MADLKTESVRLDRALERVMVGETSRIDEAQLRHFEEMLAWTRHRPGYGFRPDSLADYVFEAIMPQISDVRVLRSSRYLSTLRDLSALLSALERRDDKVVRIGAALVRGEIQRHLLLRQHLNALLEA